MGDAHDRRQVVLAMALDIDIGQHDHVVIALHILEGLAERLERIGVIAGEPLLIGLDHAFGRVDQAFTARVIPGPGDQGANGGFGLFAAWFRLGFGCDTGSVRGHGVHPHGSFRSRVGSAYTTKP